MRVMFLALSIPLLAAGVSAPALAEPEMKVTGSECYDDGHGGEVCFPMGERSFADEVIARDTGSKAPTKHEAILPESVLGPPDLKSGGQSHLSLGCGGHVAVRFADNALVDLPGADLYVFEIGGALEPTFLEISQDGEAWTKVGRVSGGKAAVDISWAIAPGESYHYVRLTDLRYNCGAPTPGADIDAIGAIGSGIRLSLESAVLFAVDSAELRPAAESELQKLAARLAELQPQRLSVHGHTDSTGAEEYNRDLSRDRAESVLAWLRDAGAIGEAVEVDIRGFGESRPVADNDTEKGRLANRRVEVIVVPKPGAAMNEALDEGLDVTKPDYPGTYGLSGRGTLKLERDGEAFVGTYTQDGGRVFLEEEAPGKLRGYWVEKGSRERCGEAKDGSHHWGRLRLEWDAFFVRFEGQWAYCDSDNWRGRWAGRWAGG